MTVRILVFQSIAISPLATSKNTQKLIKDLPRVLEIKKNHQKILTRVEVRVKSQKYRILPYKKRYYKINSD